VAAPVSWTVSGARPADGLAAVVAAIVGLRLAWTTTLSVASPVPPLPSETVTLAL
jgi:hypothetical protein